MRTIEMKQKNREGNTTSPAKKAMDLEGCAGGVRRLVQAPALLLTPSPAEGSCVCWVAAGSAGPRAPTAALKFSLCRRTSNPCSVCTEYCEVMHVQTLPEEFFVCANLQPDKVCSTGTGSSAGLRRWGRACSVSGLGLGHPLFSSLSPTDQLSSYTPKKWRAAAPNL